MLNRKATNKYEFTDAKALRDWLNLWSDKQLSVIWTENAESEHLTVDLIDNDLEDGSHTYDLRFR